MNIVEKFFMSLEHQKAKSYTIITENNHEKSVNKGHNSNIGSDEFKDVLNNKKVVRHSMKKKTSKNHKIYTQESNKYLYLVLMIRGILKMME